MVLLWLCILALSLGLSSALPNNVCKSTLTAGQFSVTSSEGTGLNNRQWCGAKGGNKDNWIEFDFPSPAGVRQIVLNKPGGKIRGYVSQFSIQYVGLQGSTLQNYGNDPNNAAVINALDDQHSGITVDLTGVAVTKLRVNIVSYQSAPCLQIELHGCTDYRSLCTSACQNGGQCLMEDTCICPNGFQGDQCQQSVTAVGGCISRLGMADGRIPDSALSVSSSKPGHGKEKARYGCCTGETGGSWCPADSDTSPWYEVKFDKPQTVGGLDFLYPYYPPGVISPQYMKAFELEFWSPLDAQKTWRSFSTDIDAIYNDTLYYTIQLTPPIVVNAIRLLPKTWKSSPCIRFDVLGCDPASLCPSDYCKNGGSCMGQMTCLCPHGYYGDQCEKTASQLVTINAGFQTIIQQTLQTTTTIKFTVHGTPQLVAGQTGQAIHITNTNQYLVIDHTTFNSCLKDLDTCASGFTITTNVLFTQLLEHTYIISSGGNLPDTKGIALYFEGGKLHFVVSTSSKKWHLVSSHTLTLNVWHRLELSWQKTLGCELIVDGKLVGSVTRPVPHQAHLVKQITLGHGYTQQPTHISMKIEGFKTLDANRASLSIAGILTTPAPTTTVITTHRTTTPTTVITTTPTVPSTTDQPTTVFSCGAKKVKFEFKEIKNNLLITPEYNFTVYKNPTIRPEKDGKAVLVLNQNGQYVELPNKGIECIQDMTKCQNGFTISLEIKWLDMTSINKRYVISSGADKVNNSGLAMYLWNGELYCAVKKDRNIWTVKKKLDVKVGDWHSYQISWNMVDGFKVFLDGKILMESRIHLPNPAQPGTFPLLIAGSPGNNETSLMEIKNLYTWTASRDVLINHTCITASPSSNIKTYDLTFISIKHNVLMTSSFNLTVHGAPHFEHHTVSSKPVLVLNGSNQYLEFSNGSNMECLNDLQSCQSGFTVKVRVSLIKVNHQQKTVIISNGNQYMNGTGMALYFYQGHLYGYVSTQKTWKVNTQFKVDVNKWHNYQISWSVTHGLTIIVDGHQVASTITSTTNHYTSIQHTLTIGKLHATSYSTYMKVTGLTIWQASHQVLVEHGLMSTVQQPPLSTTTMTSSTTTTTKATTTSSTTTTAMPSTTSTTQATTTPSTTTTTQATTTPSTTTTTQATTTPSTTTTTQATTTPSTTMTTQATTTPSTTTTTQATTTPSTTTTTQATTTPSTTMTTQATRTPSTTTTTQATTTPSTTMTTQATRTPSTTTTTQATTTPSTTMTTQATTMPSTTTTTPSTTKTTQATTTPSTTMTTQATTTPSIAVTTQATTTPSTTSTTQATTTPSTTMTTQATTTPSTTKTTQATTTPSTTMTTQATTTPSIAVTTQATTTPSTAVTTAPSKTFTTQAMKATAITPTEATISTQATQRTTRTIQEVTSTIKTVKTYDLTFISIKHNVLMTSSFNLTVHGAPHFEHHTVSSKPVLVLNGSNQYLEFSNGSNMECLNNLVNCQSGFTVKVRVSIIKVNQQQKTVIISNGNQYMNGTGMALYFYQGHLYGYVSTQKTWKVNTQFKVDVNKWHNYQISWSVTHGLTIIVDGHQVASTITSTTNHYTSIQHTLTIGKLHATSYSTYMKVTGLTIWQASHQVLVEHGLMSTALPTTTTLAPTTTKKPDIPKYEWSFTSIPHTNTIVGSQFNATIHGQLSVNTSTGVNFNNVNQYIDLGIHNNLCFGNLSVCSCGLTIKITIMFTKIEENTVVISSGAEKADGTGLAMVYRYGQFHCVVSNATDTWFSTIKRETLSLQVYHQVIISWSPSQGLKVVVDSHVVSSVTTSIKHQMITSSTEHMYIGTPPGSSSISCNYFMMSVIIWHCWIDNIVGEGELTTPIPEKTTLASTPQRTTPMRTSVATLPATTDYCRTGYVCKDDLTTPAKPTSQPATTKPSTAKPTAPSTKPTDKPTTAQQVTTKPNTAKPTSATTKPTEKPTTKKPTEKPTTKKPTTPKPTTPKPTTPKPTTKRPTTPKPTTPKPTTQKPTTQRPTTPRPSKPGYISIPHLRPGVDQTGMAHFKCEFQKSTEKNVEFVVCLNINGKCVIQRIVEGTSVYVIFTIATINQNLFRDKITCTVQARWKGQTSLTPLKPSNVITPDIILITTGTLVLTEGHPAKHIVINVTAPPQMFCCQGCQGNCQVTITTHSRYERFYQRCSSVKYISEVLVGWQGTNQSPKPGMCGTTVSQTVHISSWQQTIQIPVKATVDGRIDPNTNNHFTVQAHVVNQPKPPVTAIPHTLAVGHLQIHANNGDHHSQCSSMNDPHITTFDGRHYDNHNGGEFIMYRHTSLPYEVRGFYVKCSNRGRAYCNCGLAVKSGDDVITFSSCQRTNGNSHSHGLGGFLGALFGHHHHGHGHSSAAGIQVELYKNGELTPGTQILRIGCGQKYQVILPTGTIITVQKWNHGSFINIWIKPSSVDRGHTEGLCGSYDGNRNNDVYNPGTGRPDNHRNPQPFCMIWKQNKSIFTGVSAATFSHLNTFCSCINGKEVFCNRGHGVMMCRKSRYDITDTIIKQAKIPHISHRQKRQAIIDGSVTTTVATEINITSNYTYETALEKCESMIEDNPAVKTCWNTVNRTDLNETMENCAFDLQDTGDENFAYGYITDIVEECLNTLASQRQVVNGTVVDGSDDITAPNVTELCLQDCGQHGTCTEGVCRCAAGYSGLSCEVSAEDTIPTVILPGTATCGCDSQATDDCRTITIFGDNFVDSPSLTCHYEYAQVELSKPATLGRSVPAAYVSISQVTCTLPSSLTLSVGQGVYLSVSNNGQGYNSDWYLHTTYDSLCFDCVETGQPSPPIQYNRKDFTCLINNKCFTSGQKKPGDSCKECDPSNSKVMWTASTDESCRKCNSASNIEHLGGDEDSDNKDTITILAVVIGVVTFIAIASMFYICKLRSKQAMYKKENFTLADAYVPTEKDVPLTKTSFDNFGYSDHSGNVKL